MSDVSAVEPRSVWFSARDGLRLHARHYRAAGSKARPVLCLAGLTRNSRDFHDLAMHLAQGPGARPVWALDSRGRGLSQHDKDWKNYSLPMEMQDVIELATVAGLEGATIVGTSRGGLIAMVLGAVMPGIIGAVVLNDIGPVIEKAGLARIAAYAGRVPLPATWDDAARLVADMSRAQFPGVPDAVWMEVARQWFNEKDGKPAPGFDPAIGNAVSATVEVPELWPQFDALADVPVMVIRGENSDILSEATAGRMIERHKACSLLTVEGQGHAPLLKDRPTIEAIAAFAARPVD